MTDNVREYIDADISAAAKQAIGLRQIEQWKQVRCDAELAYRIAQRIGDPPQELERLKALITRATKALDALAAEMATDGGG